MSIELRGGVRASAVIGDSAFARQAARFLPDTRSRAVSAFDIQQKARLEEADGLDGALFTVSAAWPDPWLVAGWALAAAPRLRATVAHRPGAPSRPLPRAPWPLSTACPTGAPAYIW
ncbi:hypothetical protein P4M26_30445 [Pseudomonas aeruginosa]|nr:hypothetical protein [Pseudomonas aeruginosa]